MSTPETPPEVPPASDAELEELNALRSEHDWPAWSVAYLASMRRVPDETEAARVAGVARSTAWRLSKRSVAFEGATSEARESALDRLATVVYLRATAGTPVRKTTTKTFRDGTTEVTVLEERHISDILAMFYLKRWRPEYRDSYRVEHAGDGGGPIRLSTEERVNEAVERFDAEVVRLADARAARKSAASGGD